MSIRGTLWTLLVALLAERTFFFAAELIGWTYVAILASILVLDIIDPGTIHD
jgi:hypothetical protein